jgi:hypothetical protein
MSTRDIETLLDEPAHRPVHSVGELIKGKER